MFENRLTRKNVGVRKNYLLGPPWNRHLSYLGIRKNAGTRKNDVDDAYLGRLGIGI